MNPINLAGKVAIVTGAGKGIGREVAFAIAENDGMPVVVDIDRQSAETTAREIAAITGQAPCFQIADMSEVGAVEAMVDAVYKQFGKIDILVNNAGILDNSLIEELEEEQWDRVIDINLKSAFFCSKFVYSHMKESGSGQIVNIASVAGRMGGHSVGCAYAASKAGIIGMTKNFARKCAPYGIGVNAVAPGTVESDMSRQFTPEQLERLYANIPMKRLGTPKEIANAVVFLASGASAFITGAVIDVNGGMHMD